MIYDRIAAKLTDIYKEKGKLPVLYNDPLHVWKDITHLTYLERHNAFCYANAHMVITVFDPTFSHKPISFSEGIREVWPYLNKEEQNELMATVLGAKNGMA